MVEYVVASGWSLSEHVKINLASMKKSWTTKELDIIISYDVPIPRNLSLICNSYWDEFSYFVPSYFQS